MSNDPSQVQRREFLQAGALASAAAVTLASPGLGDEPNASKATLPTRKLGNTGVDVTILTQGTWRAPGLDRLLRFSYANGVRYYDAAKSYGSEPDIAKWMQAVPEVRKNIFLVTKDSPRDPSQMMGMLDQRLASLKTDYVDLFFIHGIGGPQKLGWPKSKELKDTIATIKKSGKARFVGFSCHDALKAEYLMAAAEGGIVDVVMVAYTPWLDKDAPLNRALDACHKKGIGLISMKQIAGNNDAKLKKVPEHVPYLKEKGLSAYQGLLHAIWTDERISTCCVSMKNLEQIAENSEAARKFVPLKAAELKGLHDAFLASKPTMCANCDGRCAVAAGTEAELGNLTRFLTYHEHHGHRSEARQQYSELSESARDWKGADLAAAQAACPSHLDFADLLPKAERYLS
jgi:uncharacterized protein